MEGKFLEALDRKHESGLDHRVFVPLTLGHIFDNHANNVMESPYRYGYGFMQGSSL